MSTTAKVRAGYGWDQPRPPSWLQFAMWVLVGPVAIAGLLAAFTPLILITGPLTALLVVAIGSKGGMNASGFGAMSGVGAALSVVAYWSPWPVWILVATFVIGGFAGYRAVTRSASFRDARCD